MQLLTSQTDLQAANPAPPDAFDGSTEPLIYMSDNRMPVMIEFHSAVIYIIFATLVLALLLILPGVRKTKLNSFLGILSLLTMGATLLLAIGGSNWLTGGVQIYDSPYGSLTSESFTGKLEVNIGLSWANVTLVGGLSDFDGLNSQQPSKNVDYNEQFNWVQPENMAKEHIQALRKGLPYPILSVTEYLSQDSDGFNWTRQLRQAGYYCSLALYLSMSSWCLTAVIMCVLPTYLPHMLQLTGTLMMASVSIYTILIQSPKSFGFQLGAGRLDFAFGHTYVITFVAGALGMFVGVLLYALQMSSPHKQLTIMDSEQFVQDQKVLYGENLTNHSLGLQSAKSSMRTVGSQINSVIIPIGDIEENFKSTTQ